MTDGPIGWAAALLAVIAIIHWAHVDLRQPTHVAAVHSIERGLR